MQKANSSPQFERYLTLLEGRIEPSQAWQSIKPYLTSKYFSDIHTNLRLLRDLYVPVSSFRYDSANLVTTLLGVSPLSLDRFEQQHTIPAEFSSQILSHEKNNFSLFFLLAPIGRGKTTFLHYQLRVHIPQVTPTLEWYPIIVDVLDCVSKKESLFSEINRHIEDTVWRAYPCFKTTSDADISRSRAILCNIFSDDLRRERVPSSPTTSEANRELFLQQDKVLRDLKEKSFLNYHRRLLDYGRKKYPQVHMVLAIDNLDQHLAVQTRRQEFILDSVGVARSLDLPLIIPLRDTSFRTNNPNDLLASFHNADYMRIENIPTERMIAKRFKAVQKQLERDKTVGPYGKVFLNALREHFSVDRPQVKRQSHFAETFPWLNKLPNSNKRRALETIGKALESKLIVQDGFDKTFKHIDEMEVLRSGIHVDKMKRALILQNSRVFKGDSADVNIMNLFDCELPDAKCNNILRLKLLQMYSGYREEGLKLRQALRLLTDVGVDEFIVRDSVRKMIEKGLLQVYLRNASDDASEYVMEGSPIDLDRYSECQTFLGENGHFHIDELIYDSVYLEEMKFATWIRWKEYQDVFKHYLSSQRAPSMGYRMDSTRTFLRYLVRVEEANNECFARLGIVQIVPQILARFNETVKNMEIFQDTRRLQPSAR